MWIKFLLRYCFLFALISFLHSFFFTRKLPGNPGIDARDIFAMNWRFFPTLDPQVDVFISRDLDSRPSGRELAALEEWLASEFILHIMRDHPGHGKTFLGKII